MPCGWVYIIEVRDQQNDAVLLTNNEACAKWGMTMKSGDVDKKSDAKG